MRKGMMTIAAAGMVLALAAPGGAQERRAQVKTGVDAWAAGDFARAIEAWRAPAEAGDADAQFNLGQAYKLGRGVPVDLVRAEQWYALAASQGHVQAEDNYGLALFENGKKREAVSWLEKSVARGEPRAQYVLGTMFFNGDIVSRDWVRAYALVSRARTAGLAQATATLEQMDRYIPMNERQQAIEVARGWESEPYRPGTATTVAATTAPVRTASRPVATTSVPPSRIETPAPASVRTPAPTPPRPATTPAPAPRPAAAPPRDGGWRVQLGAFGNAANARRLGGQMGGRFPGRTVEYVQAGNLTRVLVGPYASQAEASRACAGVSPCVATRR